MRSLLFKVYLRSLEQVIINTLQDFEIKSTRVDGLTGVWVDDSKIAAIGIKLRRWVTMHGLSLNVNPDLRYFANIVPCGIADKAVGSIVQYRPKVTLDDAADVLLRQFSKQFQVQCDVLDPAASTAFIELLTDRYSTPKVQ
jgi:lipoyl(octanoyl) transferase